MTLSTLSRLLLLLSCLLFSACCSGSSHRHHHQSSHTKPGLLCCVGDDELNKLGERLGFQVEALGLGHYAFTKGRLTFQVWTRCEPTEQGTLVGRPLELSHQVTDRGDMILSKMPVAHGVTFEAVEARFRTFIHLIEPARR
ncbi:MAG: hypothetical protein ACO1TE_17480 [Prosthecobacter sp.]